MNHKDIKIVFFGTPDFAVESLDALIKAGCNIAAVVTAPDKPAGRGHKLLESAVKQYAVAHNLPLLQPVNLKAEEFQNELKEINADLFIVIAFRMLPQSVWAMPKLGTFNVHGSLLPRYRGAAPINRALIAGETVTGVSTFYLTHEIDTGDIIGSKTTEILPEDDFGSLYDKLMKMGAELAVETVKNIADGNITRKPQEEFADITPCPAPKIFKDDCHIDWTQPAVNIHNLIRGVSPVPGAWTTLTDDKGETVMKIFKSSVTDTAASSPGRVHISPKGMRIDCGDRQLEILSIQIQGKKRMDAADFLRGSRLENPHCQ
ncbi:MAG: methionyl-tRNA formyltransferase [Paramuribaculum sp.]|nr:methionyl-tRNA formyltransferase [Paramuribaculum sp.]